MNESQRIERANRTKTLLDNAEWQAAREALRTSLFAVIENGTDEEALDARRQLKSLTRMEANLQAFLSDAALIGADQASRRSRLRIT